MNNEILKLFPEPIFKYQFENYKNINKELRNIFINYMKMTTKV